MISFIFLQKKSLNVQCLIIYRIYFKVGSQCLHYAAQEGLLDIVKLLLDEGARVNCFDHVRMQLSGQSVYRGSYIDRH